MHPLLAVSRVLESTNNTMAGKRGTNQRRKSTQDSTYLRKDLEDTGRPQQDRKYRFRDQGQLDPDDQRRVGFKKTLLESAEQSKYLEDFRKSDEEVICPNSVPKYKH